MPTTGERNFNQIILCSIFNKNHKSQNLLKQTISYKMKVQENDYIYNKTYILLLSDK